MRRKDPLDKAPFHSHLTNLRFLYLQPNYSSLPSPSNLYSILSVHLLQHVLRNPQRTPARYNRTNYQTFAPHFFSTSPVICHDPSYKFTDRTSVSFGGARMSKAALTSMLRFADGADGAFRTVLSGKDTEQSFGWEWMRDQYCF